MTGKEIVKLNESALASVLADVSFIEIEIKRLGKPELDHVFDEVKHVCNPLPPPLPGRLRWTDSWVLDYQHYPFRCCSGIYGTFDSFHVVSVCQTAEPSYDLGQTGKSCLVPGRSDQYVQGGKEKGGSRSSG